MTAASLHPAPVSWYRQRWPWLLIAGPAIVVIASFVTLWLAASTDDGVISDDYYKRGLLINREIDRTARAEAMQLGAMLRVTPDGLATVVLTGFEDSADAPEYVRLYVAHPTRAGQDRIVTLPRGPEGRYVGVLAPRPEGHWLVTIETDRWKLPTVAVAEGVSEVKMGAWQTEH